MAGGSVVAPPAARPAPYSPPPGQAEPGRGGSYLVYNGVLRSALSWPELRPTHSAAAPDWELRVEGSTPLPPGAHVLGAHSYAGDVEVRLWAAGDLWRVQTSDIGDFDITDGGRAIAWRPTSHSSRNEELARFDLLGRVLPLALHRAGALSLHGSAVVTPQGAILLLGPKGRGKSTLALALAQAGAQLLTDDVAVVEHGSTWSVVRPGVHAVRLWPDSAAQLRTESYGRPGAVGRKLLVHTIPSHLLAHATAPLVAVYLLEPAAEGAIGPAASRGPLPAVRATRELLAQATAGNLLGGAAAAEVLGRVAEVVRRAPVYTLGVARAMERLPEVVDTVLAWHAAGPAVGEAHADATGGTAR